MADAEAVRRQTVPALSKDQAIRLTLDAALAELALEGTLKHRRGNERLGIYRRFVHETKGKLAEKTPTQIALALEARLARARLETTFELGACFVSGRDEHSTAKSHASVQRKRQW